MASPFETLGVAATFALDMTALEERHRTLSGTLHPDRYSGRPAAERRMALERAIEVNSAWRQLRDPVKRAEAVLQARGIPVGERVEPKAPPALLMEMMEVRETLSDARRGKDIDQILALSEQMRKRENAVLERLGTGFEQAASDQDKLKALLPSLGELRYLRRFFEELEAIEEELLS